jgi:dTMP kinase
MSHRGLLITLEGGEGSGKSTQQNMLLRRLRALGLTVMPTHQPGATSLGRSLRDLVMGRTLEPPVDWAELMLYLADRAQHVRLEVEPALHRGEVVISDRYLDSSEVYQGMVRNLGFDKVRLMHTWICAEAWPDLTIVLDLKPELGLKRAKSRQGRLGLGLDRLEEEGLEFHRKVRQGFLERAKQEPERIKVVAAQPSSEEVATEIWELVEPLVRTWRQG